MIKPIELRTKYMEFTQNITNELVTRYINSFYHPLTAELGALRQEAEAAEIPIILKETESYLRATLAILRPKRILEIGCAVGYSAMFFAECCGAEVVTIEKDPETYETARANIRKLGYEKHVTVLCGDGAETAAELKARGANDSVEHVDFMIGTSDLKVTGIKKDGTKIPVFRDGEWCI